MAKTTGFVSATLLLANLMVANPSFVLPAVAKTSTQPFSVAVTLSAAAAKKLTNSGEGLTIAAYYNGEAKAGVETEDGTVPLNAEERLIEPGGTAKFGSISFKDRDLKKIIGKPQLTINVFTSRKKFENNLLSCDIWSGDVDQSAGETLTLACKLIGE